MAAAKPAVVSPETDVRAYLQSVGVSTESLDRPAPRVSSLRVDGDDPMGYSGPAAKMLQSAFRLSHVSTDREVEKLLARGFDVLADWRNGARGKCDVWMTGIGKRGVVMGRPKHVDSAYVAERAARDSARRHGKATVREAMGPGAYQDVRYDHEQGTVEDR